MVILCAPRSEQEQRLIEVGIICTQWACLEYLLANAIWWMLDLDHSTGKIVTGGLDINPRIDMAVDLAVHKGKDQMLVDILKTLRKELREDPHKLISRRNRAVHGIFSSTPGEETVMIELHRDRSRRQRTPYPLEELSSLRESLSSAVDRIVPIFRKLQINVD